MEKALHRIAAELKGEKQKVPIIDPPSPVPAQMWANPHARMVSRPDGGFARSHRRRDCRGNGGP